jgi:hypothetical protein
MCLLLEEKRLHILIQGLNIFRLIGSHKQRFLGQQYSPLAVPFYVALEYSTFVEGF